LAPRPLMESFLVQVCGQLHTKGFHQWAGREWRHIADSFEMDTQPALDARKRLGTMEADLQNYAAAIEALQPLLDRMRKDKNVQRMASGKGLPMGQLETRILYLQGMAAKENGEFDKARQWLQQAHELEASHTEIVIAMYRLPGDAQWQDSTRKIVTELTDLLNDSVRQQRTMGVQGRYDSRELAKRLNLVSWLIANTFGDLNLALQMSDESLRLWPDRPAYLDTNAAVHAAQGNLDIAIAQTRRALQMEPNDPGLKRNLDRYLTRLERLPGSKE
ncbi:MAG: hypothetical protein AAFN70_14995, partial [Planctomycetota bacterium]